ncbi:MAG: hypothetical protein DI535_19195 [Citrobacter freundii]|nr:MAG: hypothetical protein DI535_19195 [Citrobacter freundii]
MHNPSSKTKITLFKKAGIKKQQRSFFLAGGAGLTAGGIIAGSGNETSFDGAESGTILIGAGVLAMAGSIPLFIASKRNKEKAASLQTSLFRNSDGMFVHKIPFTLSLIVKL